ncbi:hypothetical protein E2C01_044947 [Portunus trituberculatus]|uniref:Uncharacterized protein n=1 Tax=Portunus trituberculatus TaxID=210409 RepID=A0A5B7G1U5_PORTR|nr:hypothetical protein [Portunus trituberculatus]
MRYLTSPRPQPQPQLQPRPPTPHAPLCPFLAPRPARASPHPSLPPAHLTTQHSHSRPQHLPAFYTLKQTHSSFGSNTKHFG